ncbi:PIN domain-containing protein [Halalkalibaculum sp. DA3122]|uniref:PIN domain-containing protein n=1 Tax=Halalkalibaculum sp. DA3122 TaxID=3373607 RepID=UPI0037543E61
MVFDTNIWISYVAKNWPAGIIDQIKEKRDSGEIILLTNDIIIQEWERNKETTLKDVAKKADEVFSYTKKMFENFDDEMEDKYGELVKDFLSHRSEFIETAKQQVEETEKLIKECDVTPITDEMKIKAAEWALQKQAPFIKNKNSVADAIIILSSAQYLREKSIGITDSIFVSYNHEEFSSKEDKDKIHPDLEDLLKEANMTFTRHLGKALRLPDKMLKEIDEYIEYRVQDWIETQAEIARGK